MALISLLNAVKNMRPLTPFPNPPPRKRVSAWGISERMAVAKLLEKLRKQGTTLALAPSSQSEHTTPGYSFTLERWANEWYGT